MCPKAFMQRLLLEKMIFTLMDRGISLRTLFRRLDHGMWGRGFKLVDYCFGIHRVGGPSAGEAWIPP